MHPHRKEISDNPVTTGSYSQERNEIANRREETENTHHRFELITTQEKISNLWHSLTRFNRQSIGRADSNMLDLQRMLLSS